MIRFSKFFFHNSIKLFGQRGIKWLVVGLFASMGIALVELALSIVIQLLLICFGFLPASAQMSYLKFIPFPITIHWVTFALCLVALARFVVQLASTQTSAFIRDYVSQRLRQNSVYQLLYSESPEARFSSSINFKISEVFVKASDFVFNVCLFLSMFIQIVFLFLIMFAIAWKESFITLFGISIIGACVLLINKKVSKIAKSVPVEQRKLNESIEKIARNFIFIKLMKKRKEEYNSITEFITEYSSQSTRANFFSNLAAQTGPFLGILLLICVILLSQSLWHTVPLILISFIYLLSRFVQSLSILSLYFGSASISFPQYKLALESITSSESNLDDLICNHKMSVFGVKQKSLVSNSAHSHGEFDLKISSPEIIFQNMTFSYANSEPLFENINFKITAGSQIGIIGSSGTGKSTLLMLITGILKPVSGTILIENIPAHEYTSKQNIRIGYVGAEPFLIRGTIKENLCYGLSSAVTDEEIYNILNLVALEKLAREKGLHYIINEDHSGISAGQKQRLCLARAILNKPSLLILDEATANLDEHNERLVAQILNNLKGECTTLIVSHRPGVLINADKVLEMKDFIKNV